MIRRMYSIEEIMKYEPYTLKVKSRAWFLEEYIILYEDTEIEKFWGGLSYFREAKEKANLLNVAYREGMMRVAMDNDLL